MKNVTIYNWQRSQWLAQLLAIEAAFGLLDIKEHALEGICRSVNKWLRGPSRILIVCRWMEGKWNIRRSNLQASPTFSLAVFRQTKHVKIIEKGLDSPRIVTSIGAKNSSYRISCSALRSNERMYYLKYSQMLMNNIFQINKTWATRASIWRKHVTSSFNSLVAFRAYLGSKQHIQNQFPTPK